MSEKAGKANSSFRRPLPVPTLLKVYRDSIRREIFGPAPPAYPFTRYGAALRTAQGLYLRRCSQNLFELFAAALAIEDVREEATTGEDAHVSYAEGRRLSAERQFFARNPGLALAAKKRHGNTCMVCGFDFARAYGALGEGYIEAHHLDPLSEHDPSEWRKGIRTNVNDVAVVCANCHRMIHRRRPALSIDELRDRIKAAGNGPA